MTGHDRATAVRNDGRRGLRLRWVLANIVGFTVGGATAGAMVGTMGQSSYESVTSTADAVLIATRNAGAALSVWGAAVGLMQWLAIRRELRQVGWWSLATSAGWALAGMIAGLLSGLIGGAVTGIGRDVGVWDFVIAAAGGVTALGFLPGVFQWRILRRDVDHASRWLWGSAVAFVVAAGVAAAVVRWAMVEVIGCFARRTSLPPRHGSPSEPSPECSTELSRAWWSASY
jgi:hypothetical protein